MLLLIKVLDLGGERRVNFAISACSLYRGTIPVRDPMHDCMAGYTLSFVLP